MSQLRQDPTTREWVIIATERARRPHDFAAAESAAKSAALPSYNATCPFCPGNETMTPDEVFRIGNADSVSDWQVRVVPNKFAALTPQGDPSRLSDGLFHTMNGFGFHEVIIETPLHNRPIPLMSVDEVEQVLRASWARYLALHAAPKVKLIVLFKNHGRAAGTSLEHPHIQIVGVPTIPGSVRARNEVAQRYYDDTGRCVYCDVLAQEKNIGKRIIIETAEFTVYQPFASRVPFETWIMPCCHGATFPSDGEIECRMLAPLLHLTLAKLYHGLQNPDYNVVFQTAPIEDEDTPYHHWHIRIYPRLTLQAGFELGSGIYINTALPEETAQYMREVVVPPSQ